MAFNGAATITPPGVDTTTFTLVDASTGTDAGLTGRQVFLYKADGTTLTPVGSSTPYINWPLPLATPLVLTGILDKDYSLNIVVNWISSAPIAPPSTYTQNQLYTFTSNIMLFFYSLTELASANNALINDNRYFPNKEMLKVYIENAINAQQYNNQYAAQLALSAAYKMQLNKQYLF